jgi:hypothetical protein
MVVSHPSEVSSPSTQLSLTFVVTAVLIAVHLLRDENRRELSVEEPTTRTDEVFDKLRQGYGTIVYPPTLEQRAAMKIGGSCAVAAPEVVLE